MTDKHPLINFHDIKLFKHIVQYSYNKFSKFDTYI